MNNLASSPQHAPESRPALPQRKAFVLRFAEDAGPLTGLFSGRVEHVTSGDQAAFSSVEQLFTFVRLVLSRTEKPAALPPGAGGQGGRAADGLRHGTRVAAPRG